MANSSLQSLLTAVYRTPVFTKAGTMDSAWQQFLQGLINNSGSGNTGNTTINTNFGLVDDRNALDGRIDALERQIIFALDNPAMSIATQALDTQQSNNAINTIADVLDLIKLNETGIILNNPSMYLAALPDANANLDFTVHWNDVITGAATANSAVGNSNSNTEMQIVGPPNRVLGQAMDIQLLTIVNNDAINANIALYINNGPNTNTDILSDVLLQPGYTLIFDENGFRVLNASGIPLRH